MVRFEYEGKGENSSPRLRYWPESGDGHRSLANRVVDSFSYQDKALVCNACNTEWSLETLKGIKGGCMNYPPEVIPSTIEKDRVLIEESVVLGWKPRV
jgi:hypothetical protein